MSFLYDSSVKVTNKQLGSGRFGIVFEGTYEGNEVAVKRIPVELINILTQEEKREVEEHIQLDHENVIKLLHIDEEKNVSFRLLYMFTGRVVFFIFSG
jgi:serine/threonine protein kinase